MDRRNVLIGTSCLIALAAWPVDSGEATPMDTMKLPTKPDYLAPDGSEIRLLVATPRGSMAHCKLPPNAVL
jgi:hypothetical protein